MSNDWTTFVAITVLKSAVLLGVLLTVVAYTVWLERKVIGHIQNRWGPTRVGPFGLLQPLADGVKLLLKEDVALNAVDRPLYILAPILSVGLALTSISVIPIGESFTVRGVPVQLQIADVNIALLVLLGVTSIGVYGIALAGWSSNSKYSLLGALRACAQMVSYELSLGLSLVGVLILAGSLSLREIVNRQGEWPWQWNVIAGGQLVAFFIYLTAAFAETNRIPFDLPEGETELVAGYHTEYSSMKFAMFFMAEYTNMVTVACVATTVFLGGWHGPLFGPAPLQAVLPLFWFLLKVFFFLFLYIWVRGTLPRFRYDQLMAFGWKVLLPLAIANVLVTSFVVAVGS
ncbi:MAG: NADH-quinone oxidoreductase subunit NuoH [Terriglobales bacterium]